MHRQRQASLAAQALTPWLTWVSAVLVLAALTGCGQKGPLFLPPAAAGASAAAR